MAIENKEFRGQTFLVKRLLTDAAGDPVEISTIGLEIKVEIIDTLGFIVLVGTLTGGEVIQGTPVNQFIYELSEVQTRKLARGLVIARYTIDAPSVEYQDGSGRDKIEEDLITLTN